MKKCGKNFPIFEWKNSKGKQLLKLNESLTYNQKISFVLLQCKWRQ